MGAGRSRRQCVWSGRHGRAFITSSRRFQSHLTIISNFRPLRLCITGACGCRGSVPDNGAEPAGTGCRRCGEVWKGKGGGGGGLGEANEWSYPSTGLGRAVAADQPLHGLIKLVMRRGSVLCFVCGSRLSCRSKTTVKMFTVLHLTLQSSSGGTMRH